MDFNVARANMVEQQIRTWEVLDRNVLDAVTAMQREHYVPDGFRDLAFSDCEIPLGHNQAMMPPKLEARIVQSLDLKSSDKILEIGTGSGYLTALLAHLGGEVLSIELYGDLGDAAQRVLSAQGVSNAKVINGDALAGWPADAPYDVIVATGSYFQPNLALREQLNLDGRLFQIIGASPVMEATVVRRIGDEEFAIESLFETNIAPLIGAETKHKFIF